MNGFVRGVLDGLGLVAFIWMICKFLEVLTE